jgi:TRAP-type C4-dicarboxylate transport system substrate-binding protein
VPDVLLISTVIWNDLSEDEKKWIQESADESYKYQKVLWQEATTDALEKVKEAGVKIYYPDKTLFETKVQSLIAEFENDKNIFTLIQEIKKLK